jgi:methylmalonyl-CoA mutase N-terminal domain/subunit
VSNKKNWLETTYKQASERPVRFSTVSDMELDALYTPDDVTGSYDDALGNPGEFPYTRGVYGSMYRGRLWTMRQFAGFGLAEDTNARRSWTRGRVGLDRLRHGDAVRSDSAGPRHHLDDGELFGVDPARDVPGRGRA